MCIRDRMYGFGMLRAAKIIRHQKVIDLLYDNRKNEEYHFKSFRHSLLVVLLSIAAIDVYKRQDYRERRN